MKKILVVNCGSSTIKFQLIEMEDEKVIAKGRCDQVGYKTSNILYKNFFNRSYSSSKYPLFIKMLFSK